mmetsp:Transcript_2601/g.6706  ORF Transcript_2601/g.6706 Transcript_2601/m.6706 type:complete len:200 (+) Transcript_2601:536-1135(+)
MPLGRIVRECVLVIRHAVFVAVGLVQRIVGVWVLLIRHPIAVPVRVGVVADAVAVEVAPLRAVPGELVILVEDAIPVDIGIGAVGDTVLVHVRSGCRSGLGSRRRRRYGGWRRARWDDQVLLDTHRQVHLRLLVPLLLLHKRLGRRGRSAGLVYDYPQDLGQIAVPGAAEALVLAELLDTLPEGAAQACARLVICAIHA